MAEDVQVPEGAQGSEGTTTEAGLFDSYLSAVPDDARETVASYLKDAEKNVNSRLEKAAELEKTLGPYQQVDLSGYPPEQLQELLAWHQQVTSSDDALKAWVEQTAREQGLIEAEQADAEEGAPGDLSREDIQKLVEDRAAEQVGPLEQRLSAWEEQQQVSAVEQEINTTLAELEKEHKLTLDDDAKAEILDLGIGHESEEPGGWVKHGFDRYQKIGAASQAQFVADKTGTPTAGLSAGGAPAFKPATTFEEANKQARERFKSLS